jgi:hypothetical protein
VRHNGVGVVVGWGGVGREGNEIMNNEMREREGSRRRKTKSSVFRHFAERRINFPAAERKRRNGWPYLRKS